MAMNRHPLIALPVWTVRGAFSTLALLVSLTLAACGGGSPQTPPPPQPVFIVEAVPSAPLMTPGSSLQVDIPVLGVPPWTGVVAVTIAGQYAGVTVTPNSFSVDTTKGGGQTVTVAADSSSAVGAYAFMVTGTSGSVSHSATLTAGVFNPPQPVPMQAQVLNSFSGAQDGGDPEGALISDSAGNFYGTTYEGGSYGPGKVFELSFSNGTWQETVLHSFGNGTDGASPIGSLVFDSTGNLYGVTRLGGTSANTPGICFTQGCGTVFELTPTSSGWRETVLHNFTAGTDGFYPAAGLAFDGFGNLYGTTENGGQISNNICINVGCGTVFALTPTGNGWSYSVIYDFQGTPDGNDPNAGLSFDLMGNLYGTTYTGGTGGCLGGGGCGTVFKMTSSGGAWHESVLYSFQGVDGFGPSGLVLDSTGKIYGTTTGGGFEASQCNNDSCGTFLSSAPRAAVGR